jgi:hypothetical protein
MDSKYDRPSRQAVDALVRFVLEFPGVKHRPDRRPAVAGSADPISLE